MHYAEFLYILMKFCDLSSLLYLRYLIVSLSINQVVSITHTK